MLKINQLNFSYTRNTPVLENINYTFEKGKVYALVGANGAGKTTLFKLLLNQLLPNDGSVVLNGSHHLEDRVNYQRQLVFSGDEPHFLPYLTGREWLLFVLSAYHQKPDAEKLAKLQDIFDFSELDLKTEEYSHGMNKKLSMIINFMIDCQCLLFDESVAGIDPFTLRNIYDLIEETKEEKIIILSSHSRDLIEACSDQVLLLKNKHLGDINQFDDIFAD